jgi:GrpB-like predicted nucleotidyltransferase (UPF0157 family)
VNRLTEIGLGLDYGSVQLSRTAEEWLAAGLELRGRVLDALVGVTTHVEVIGSSSVLGLLAKPILDLAVGHTIDQPLAPTATRLEANGWIHRGDAGTGGGHVFVLESRPWHRVAHLHVVTYEGEAWRNYLCLRDLLRRDHHARERYEAVKVQLVQDESVDRKSYTLGKTTVITSLLEQASRMPSQGGPCFPGPSPGPP